MKITELISVFERLLPIYEKAYKENLNFMDLQYLCLNYGLCASAKKHCNIEIYDVIYDYYHKTYSFGTYLFRLPKKSKDLKPRIDFMKSEIKDLKRLIKLGYTHI